jgi:uncharacterized protein
MLWFFVKFNHIAGPGRHNCDRDMRLIFDSGLSATYHAPAMGNPILERVLPAELADRGQIIEFKGDIGSFERLMGIAEADFAALEAKNQPRDWRTAPVEASLEFAWTDARKALPAATGRFRVEMPVVCQRCLEPFRMRVQSPLRLLFTSGEEPGDSADTPDYEAWELEADSISLQDVLEESIVMALPLAPVHEKAAECGPLAGDIPAGEADTIRPFADLKLQMEKANK